MSVMGPDGKILQPGGGWWSPYGNTDEEIRENMKTGRMPNAEDAIRVGPRTITGTAKGDDNLRDFLGDIGALGGQAKESYEAKKKDKEKATAKKKAKRKPYTSSFLDQLEALGEDDE